MAKILRNDGLQFDGPIAEADFWRRLNILVCRGLYGGVVVRVRESYTAIDPVEGRPTMFHVRAREARPELGENWADVGEGHCGHRAIAQCWPHDIRLAVARLREEWGNLHVQDNTGIVPDLDQGNWHNPPRPERIPVDATTVREARERAGLTIARASRLVDVPEEIWVDWENGTRQSNTRCLERFAAEVECLREQAARDLTF